jgi:hypothetical protein
MGLVTSKVSDALDASQTKMLEAQRENMKTQMARQMRIMNAANVAWSRDFVQWVGGVWTLAVTGAILAKFNHGVVPSPLKVPLVVLPIVGSYNWDLAYGTKADRIQREMMKVLHEEDHWFSKQDKDFTL